MTITDLYELEQSKIFNIRNRQEIIINLSLKKLPPSPDTKLSGCVVNMCQPIPDATVKILDKNLNPVTHTFTDCNGYFSIIGILSEGMYYIIATAKHFCTSEVYQVCLKNGIDTFISIELRYNSIICKGTVYGLVMDGSGQKITESKIVIYKQNHLDEPVAVSTSNSDGEYLVYGLHPGVYYINAIKDGYKQHNYSSFTIESSDIIALDLILFNLSKVGIGFISGQVNYENSPVANAPVFLYHVNGSDHKLIQETEANSDGLYLFSEVKPGDYLVKSKYEIVSRKVE